MHGLVQYLNKPTLSLPQRVQPRSNLKEKQMYSRSFLNSPNIIGADNAPLHLPLNQYLHNGSRPFIVEVPDPILLNPSTRSPIRKVILTAPHVPSIYDPLLALNNEPFLFITWLVCFTIWLARPFRA